MSAVPQLAKQHRELNDVIIDAFQCHINQQMKDLEHEILQRCNMEYRGGGNKGSVHNCIRNRKESMLAQYRNLKHQHEINSVSGRMKDDYGIASALELFSLTKFAVVLYKAGSIGKCTHN